MVVRLGRCGTTHNDQPRREALFFAMGLAVKLVGFGRSMGAMTGRQAKKEET
jgi:hypothetical protein